MPDLKQEILSRIDRDRDGLIEFFRGFTRVPTPNPPGDTRAGAAFIADFLRAKGLPHRIIAPKEHMPNIVGSFDCGKPGRHLVLNGHIDVFPVGDGAGWTRDPWGGELVDGKIYGRGTADMKCGTSASVLTYAYLHSIREHLHGRLTLTAVSDEETGGEWGTGYLHEHHADEVLGDCCLNGEPSSPWTVRFGEKSPYWLKFTIRTPGAHGAYTHMSASATKIAGKLMAELEAVTEIIPRAPDNVVRALSQPEVKAIIDRGLGKGASEVIQQVTLNIGRLEGGLKVNMLPGECTIEADIRLPVGVTKAEVQAVVSRILRGFPEVTVEEMSRPSDGPNWCDPAGEMLRIVQDNAEKLNGFRPVPIVTLGGTDARYWRYRNVPGYVFGCSPGRMSTTDESVSVDEYLLVVRTHMLSAIDYLSRPRGQP